MAVQRTRRRELAGDLCRDPAPASSVEGASEQDGPQRCAWHRADDAGGALSPCACEDVTQPETADAADPSQAASVEGHCRRERPACQLAQLRPQGRHGGDGEVRGADQGACRNLPDLAVLVEPLLIVRRVVREQLGILHRRVLAVVRDDDVCRRLMTIPGVGPVVALTYRVTVDVPARFRNSKAVGAVFGLTPAKYQSG